ncbi:DUF2490 domain-containing protein [Candidatus Omnitrophota bacterium]
MKQVSKVVLIALVWTIALGGLCFAFDDGDFQHWNTDSVSWKIDDDWKLTLEEEFRWGDNARNPYYQHSDLNAAFFGLAQWLDVSASYRQVYEEKGGGWKAENRPHMNATVKWKWSDFSFSNRGRFAYRNREDAENFWQFRNKFTIKLPFKLTELEIQPYIANEIFYDFNVNAYKRNRLSGGFAFKLLEHLKAELYYLWQSSEKNDDWNDTHVLGTKFKLSF